MRTYDAIVIGGGHNGLVAALYLAKAGWSVAVVERNDSVGGAIAGGEVTLPGFEPDLYSTNQNLFLGCAAYADFGTDLTRLGLKFRVTHQPYSNVFPDGRSLRVHHDHEKTLEGLAAHSRADAEGFERLTRCTVGSPPTCSRSTARRCRREPPSEKSRDWSGSRGCAVRSTWPGRC
ncbi:FAD-dependent oxidoreductase [Amycolatopsis sp. NPDC050768]|uniref:phytoene desaturase family protein n=1 Tax=Amycolatopsis sp. NPDC050768 TaxID=3154839 RepID=UPI0033CF93F6